MQSRAAINSALELFLRDFGNGGSCGYLALGHARVMTGLHLCLDDGTVSQIGPRPLVLELLQQLPRPPDRARSDAQAT